jgi:hypothetical protein
MMSRAGFVSAIREDPRMGSEIRYARSGEVHIAYRVFGDGPRDLVLIPSTLSHAELFWEFPINQYLLKRLTSVARVVVRDLVAGSGIGFDDRGSQALKGVPGDWRLFAVTST